ncbi:MAG: hypothetical protein SF066_07225, partial [Thermoanaerobaculia bacterium]|nr:hypothetical protein [Thermoanaerobaculia bacterium]
AFLSWLEASEAEVERARNARRISATEADDWGDRAYLLLGWLARRIGHDEQVQDVLDAFAEPPPSTHSLTTQAWVLHFQGMVAADRGDVRGARALLRQALERVPNVALSIEIELFHDYIEVLVQNGRRAYAAERLAELVLEARFAWPLADLLRIGFRAVELLSAAGRTGPARELLDLLATQTRPDDAPALYFTRAQLCLHGGAYRAAQALFEYLRASEPRSTEFAVRAALGLAQLAALDGSHQDAKAWARSIQEDLLHLSPDLPRRRGLEAALASLDAAVDDELPQALADADAWLVVSRHAPARPFQRPFPGARPVVPRAIDDEVSDFGNPGGGTATVH